MNSSVTYSELEQAKADVESITESRNRTSIRDAESRINARARRLTIMFWLMLCVSLIAGGIGFLGALGVASEHDELKLQVDNLLSSDHQIDNKLEAEVATLHRQLDACEAQIVEMKYQIKSLQISTESSSKILEKADKFDKVREQAK